MTTTTPSPPLPPSPECRPTSFRAALPASTSIGIYVHFPWCLAKCPYCDFLSIPARPETLPHRKYADAVIRELTARAPGVAGRPVHSVFFGGGTPSLWALTELKRVIEALRAAFQIPDSAEITAECNPSSLDADKARALVDAGVNRLSVGLQSLDDDRLKFLGRWHTSEEGLRSLKGAVQSGASRVSADLIFGVHGQTAQAAAEEARIVAEMGLTHLSAYALTIEDGTRFGALHRAKRLPILAESEAVACFEQVGTQLTAVGFRQYEISNFCREDAVSRHNLGYWLGRDYVGLGCGAWGTLSHPETPRHAVRYRNTLSPERYMALESWALPEAPQSAAGWEAYQHLEALDAETLLKERLMLGLRLDTGLDTAQLQAELGVPFATKSRQRAVRKLQQRGRIVVEGSHIVIPAQARQFSDGTIAELI